ncbi:RNA-binding domain-containing protein [Coprinopsis marcescibilis]|uniref:RNA-binding domain-containing protein n=1 Tax=Coprinopsis marcescibilis TaxID=230819 RepID=A0A5C3KHM3_COPMA|nr:RNA-binding domain-containing protein [Coprinopsis marcescibilis]
MPPKKAKKIALSEFLGDGGLGSWADEMDQLPSAPAPKNDDESGQTSDSRFGRRDDYSRPERSGIPREDVPLPTAPPYTAFVGNLAFDLVEDDIANHFSELKINTVKIIKDKDDRPKGFGYVEFQSLEDLKQAIAQSNTSLSGRTIRVSVAEPPKERTGFGGQDRDDDSKFDNPWRRDGPLPDLPGRGDGGRRRFEPGTGAPAERTSSLTDTVSDWRSSRPPRASAPPPAESDTGSFRRKGSAQFAGDGAADKEDSWTIGGRFKAATAGEEGGSRFGSARPRGEFTPKESVADEGDWRGSSRPARAFVKPSGSPTDSTPPTPQRRKLELLPRSGNVSKSPSPLSSPKLASQAAGASRANPFGAAKPVDVTQREKEVESRIEREREIQKDRAPLSRTTSRTGSDRNAATRVATPPPTTQVRGAGSPKPIPTSLNSTVRPSLSFANVAAKKDGSDAGANTEQDATTEKAS